MTKDKMAWIVLLIIVGGALFLLLDFIGYIEFFWKADPNLS